MRTIIRVTQYGLAALLLHFCATIYGQAKPKTEYFSADQSDAFDEVFDKYLRVNADNCHIKHVSELFMPEDTVSHKPDIKEININPVLPNRTDMLHIHNMALSRSFFFSFILQSRFNRPNTNETYDPGLMYYYLSTIADVSANPKLNASAVYFSPNMSYSPSYRGFFNLTMPLFAPRTYRADDYNDPIHLERISTLNMFVSKDLGAIPDGNLGDNYTSDYYRINEWYKLWLPDSSVKKQLQDTKTVYDIRIRFANNTNITFSFHGPPGADEFPGPVKWSRPYFDCGRSNVWKFAAAVPVADIYPRMTQFRHIEYPTYVAVTVMEMDFERIDINQCPKTQGNDKPNRFAGTDKCKKDSTFCEPLYGYGFRRGGYQCRCAPNYRLPNVVRRPYLGEIIERASRQQYMDPQQFSCDRIGFIQKLPVKKIKSPTWMSSLYKEKYYEYNNWTRESQANLDSIHTREDTKTTRINPDNIVNFIQSVNPKNCHTKDKDELNLRGDISYGAEQQFKNEALMAVRTANFISSFLQVVNPNEVFPGTRIVDKPLNEDQMIGEALAMVMGNTKIWSAGIYFDANQFSNRSYFAPLAYKKEFNTRKFEVEDLARLNSSEHLYTNKPWFKDIKSRWGNFYDNLEKHWLKMFFRSRSGGRDQSKFGSGVYDNIYLRRYEHFPEYYRAANLTQGIWTAPYFDCDGLVKRWLITYVSPFFGWNSLRNRIEFKGAVAVSMDIKALDINQCPGDYYTPNAFKRTHKCDDKTSYCVPIQGRGFKTGGYKCMCKQGYEYPFEDPIDYFDGQRLDAEFINLVEDKANWFDIYKCRLAGVGGLSSSVTVTVLISLVCLLLRPALNR